MESALESVIRAPRRAPRRRGKALLLLAAGRRVRERGDRCLEVRDGTHGCAGVLVLRRRAVLATNGGTAEKFAGRLGAQTKIRGKTDWYSMADRVCDM